MKSISFFVTELRFRCNSGVKLSSSCDDEDGRLEFAALEVPVMLPIPTLSKPDVDCCCDDNCN